MVSCNWSLRKMDEAGSVKVFGVNLTILLQLYD